MNEVDKAVIIMYPDCRTTGGNPGLENGRTPPVRLLADEFFKTTDMLMGRYKNRGYQIFGVTYADTEPENFSPLYPYFRFDKLVSLNFDLKHWNREQHKENLENLLLRLQIRPKAKTIVGGYHTFDCVALMAKVLSDRDFSVSADLRLTYELGPLLVAHKIRRMMGQIEKEEREWDRLIWQDQYDRFWNKVSAI